MTPIPTSVDRFELTCEDITKLRKSAEGRNSITWPATPLPGVSWLEHRLSFSDILIKVANRLYRELREMKRPLTLVASIGVANIVEALPGFQPVDSDTIRSYRGILNGTWALHVDVEILPENHFVLASGDAAIRGMIEVGEGSLL